MENFIFFVRYMVKLMERKTPKKNKLRLQITFGSEHTKCKISSISFLQLLNKSMLFKNTPKGYSRRTKITFLYGVMFFYTK